MHRDAISGCDLPQVFTPASVMTGAKLAGPVVVFDDDHYCMGAVIAKALRRDGLSVSPVTPTSRVSTWAQYTTEQDRSQARLFELDVDVVTDKALVNFAGEAVDLACVYTGRTSRRAAASPVVVTARTPNDDLYQALTAEPATLRSTGVQSVTRIGDCLAPGTITAAVFSGHCYARELDASNPGGVRFQRERATV